MKQYLLAAVMAAVSVPALAADVGVSISVGQPGFYGRIDIGDVPQPVLINPSPVVIERAPMGVAQRPIYLHVPPGHAKHWRHYCQKYNACGQPVYFVQDRWYNDVYVPHYRERHDVRDQRHDDHRDDRYGGRDDNPGRGHDKGHGKH
jgi:hypothetical protein